VYRRVLDREVENWESFASNLKETVDRDLFNQMLKSAYKYSNSIEAKGENYSTQSLLMSLLLEQHKKLISLPKKTPT
jgi:heme oxygenase